MRFKFDKSTKNESRVNQLCVMLAMASIIHSLASNQSFADEKKNPHAKWEKAIQAFEKQDKENPPMKGGVLFVGSSSIRMWDLKKSFPKLNAINRGFGGSEIADSIHFADRIVFKHEPKIIVLYAGDNDIAKGKTPERVISDFKKFAALVAKKSPQSRLIFVAIKPSVRRWNLAEPMKKSNDAIRMICDADRKLLYLDIWNPMLDDDGKPKPELFIKDGLHLNADGYRLWDSILKPHLQQH